MTVTRIELLEETARLLSETKPAEYGTPSDSFTHIAALWSAYMGVAFAPHEVAIMMALVKVARIAHDPKKLDSWADLAGYAACGAEVSL